MPSDAEKPTNGDTSKTKGEKDKGESDMSESERNEIDVSRSMRPVDGDEKDKDKDKDKGI